MPSGPAVVAVDARLPSERQAATDPEAGEAAVTLADVHALVDSLARSGAEPSALQQACLESARASPTVTNATSTARSGALSERKLLTNDIRAVANARGEVAWTARRTLPYILFGEERYYKSLRLLAQPWSLVLFSILFFSTIIAIFLALFRVVPATVTLVLNVVFTLFVYFGISPFMYDTGVLKLLVNSYLAIIGVNLYTLCCMLSYDARASAVGPISTAHTFVLFLDSAPSWIRYGTGDFVLLVALSWNFALFVLFNLFLVPGQVDPTFEIPFLNGLAGHPIIYDTQSTFNSTSVALMALFVHWIYASYKAAKHGRLTFIYVNVFARDEPDDRLDGDAVALLAWGRDATLKAVGARTEDDSV